MNTLVWTPAMDAVIVDNRGLLSMAVLADMLKVTRNAVAGRTNRLRLAPLARLRVNVKVPPKVCAVRRVRAARVRAPRREWMPAVAIASTAPDSMSLMLMDLQPRHCRCITSGDVAPVFYCGRETVSGSSYCSHHARVFGGRRW